MAMKGAKTTQAASSSGGKSSKYEASSGGKKSKAKYDPKKRKFQSNTKSSADDSLTPANKKRALKAERQSHRKHATTVRSAKEIWNELRVKTNDKETNIKLCAELHELLKGKCLEVAMQHDASRCVQGVLQFGNEKQRLEVVKELCGGDTKKDDDTKNQNMNLAELCKIQYSHFVVLKMIKYCCRDEECIKLIVKVGTTSCMHFAHLLCILTGCFASKYLSFKSLKKQMTKLAVHSVGARVIELLFGTFPSKSVAPLKLELYGPQYALFASVGSNSSTLPPLTEFVENNPDKREPTLSHLQTLLQKGLDKSLTGFGYFHSLLLDYASIASPEDIRSFLAPSLAEHSLHLLSTRAGTKVVCECAAYGNVKDRKKMLKCLKGYTRSSLKHRDAYLAILRMCDVMDDTVLVNKMLLGELHQNPDNEKANDEENEVSPILDLLLSDTGSKLFLLLLVSKEEMSSSDDDGDEKASPRWHKYLDPYEVSVLHQNPTVNENGEQVSTSKKEDDTRRRELLVYLKELLIDVCTKHTEKLMRSKPGSKVLIEVCENFATEELFKAIVEGCAGDGEDEKTLPLLEDPVGHLTMKHLFLSESKKSSNDDDISLARLFYARFDERLGSIATSNRGAFVLSSLIKTCVKDEVKKTLKLHKKEISNLAKGGKGKKLAGCKVLLDALK
jgi:pumilio family protein 6